MLCAVGKKSALLLLAVAASECLAYASVNLTTARASVQDLFRGDNQDCASCHRFDGIGGLSGGGATSRLLVEYPEDIQNEILDFLFKPNFGASLHILKVEIGGDSYSTDGSESSHMHSQDDLNLERGYEWWLLKEAKKRNPDIVTYGLPWSFPGWINTEHKRKPFEHLDRVTNYTLNWIKGAKEVHNIDIDYLGVWNEAGTSREYVLAMRKVLNDHGFDKVKLVSNDGQAEPLCPLLVNDTAYRNAIDVLGFHYPGDDKPIWPLCNSFDTPIWSSEESSSYDDLNGAACWARVISSHYVLNNMTANIMWNLLGSYYHGTNWYASSMMTAVQPWTGYYEYEQMPVIWATAHYTQFLQIGWQFLPVGQGSGELAQGGYYTTLVSPDQKYFTVVVVKISRDHAPCTRPNLWNWDTADEIFQLTIDLPGACAGRDDTQTWYSNLEREDTVLFEKQEDLNHRLSSNKPHVCSYEITLNVTVGSVFTVTNQMNVGNKGKPAIKKDSDPRFPMPYSDDFNDYECTNCYSKYLSDQMGAFEIQFVDDDGDDPAKKQQQKRALVQMAPDLPVGWFSSASYGPSTLIGMTEWEDVQVDTSFRLPDTSTLACVATRTDQLWGNGISFCVNTTQWFLLYGGPDLHGIKPSNIIESGATNLAPHKWTNMALLTLNQQVSGSIEDTVVTSKDCSVRLGDSGFVRLGASAYVAVQFGHINISPVGSHWSVSEPAPPVVDTTPWTIKLDLCTANGLTTDSERFDVTANWQIKHLATGKCVAQIPADDGPEEAEDAKLTLADCLHDEPLQQFRHKYTLLRNGNMVRMNNGHRGDLCANKDGRVTLANKAKACANEDDSFSSWSLYPNTGQLRTSFGYDPKNGGRAHCLQAVQEEPIPLIQESMPWTLTLDLCTPNGLTTNSERFDVTANWQIKHLATGKCVSQIPAEAGLEEEDARLSLVDCVHDEPLQQFRNSWTYLRNGYMVSLVNGPRGALCANKDGRVTLSNKSKACASKDDSFSAWSLYPNTGQLRTSFGYDAKNGGRVHCLKAVQGKLPPTQPPHKAKPKGGNTLTSIPEKIETLEQ